MNIQEKLANWNKKLNGWQRLYLLFMSVSCIFLLFMWYGSKPQENDYVYRFKVTGPDGAVYQVNAPEWAFKQEAINYVRAQIADHQQTPHESLYDRDMSRWRSSFLFGFNVFILFFAGLYCLGYGVGWVWKGFFPRR